MRLSDITIGILRSALSNYFDIAFEGAPTRAMPQFTGADSDPVENILPQFLDETPKMEGCARRYVLRLGNSRYPFMKLVLEEHLIRGEYFLLVDTHDEMFHAAAEQKELVELKKFNANLKERIEQRWREQGIPTLAHLQRMLESQLITRLPPRDLRILIVDDDQPAAEVLSLLLQGRGFETELACDGKVALDTVDPVRHNLVIMDVDMPVMTGLEACRAMKASERICSIPVLLATAGALELRNMNPADAFLVKPFQAEILFSFLEHLLSRSRKNQDDAGSRP